MARGKLIGLVLAGLMLLGGSVLAAKKVIPAAPRTIIKFAGVRGSDMSKGQLRDIYKIMKRRAFANYGVARVTLTPIENGFAGCYGLPNQNDGGFVNLGRQGFTVQAVMQDGRKVDLPEVSFHFTNIGTTPLIPWRMSKKLFQAELVNPVERPVQVNQGGGGFIHNQGADIFADLLN